MNQKSRAFAVTARFEAFARPLLVRTDQARIARHIGGKDRGETAGLGHFASPAAKRRPDRKSSRFSALRKFVTVGTTTDVIIRNRFTISWASSSRPMWA